MVGGQIAVGFGGINSPVTGWTLSSSSRMATSIPATCGNAAAVRSARSRRLLGLGQGAGDAARDGDVGRRRGPAIAGTVDGSHGELEARAGGKLQVAQMHLDPLARAGGQRDQLARHGRPSSVTKNPRVPAGHRRGA